MSHTGRRAAQPTPPRRTGKRPEPVAATRRSVAKPEPIALKRPLAWRHDVTHFEVDTATTHFYGWFRVTGPAQYAVDVFAKVMSSEAEFNVKTLHYRNDDPRQDMVSLDADIVGACLEWERIKLNGHALDIDELVKRSKSPLVVINTLATIDTLILKLKEFRDTAISSGGTRFFEMKGDKPDGPIVTFEINVTRQAVILKGKPPSLKTGVMADNATGRRSDTIPNRVLNVTPASGNVEAIVEELRKAKESGDEKKQRQLRATLRKMGHKGGSRSVKG